MAIGAPASRGTGSESASDTQLSFTTTGGIAAGDYILVSFITDPISTTDGDNSLHSSVSVGGVSLTKAKEWAEGGASTGDGVVTSLWYGVTGSAIASGATVLCNTASAVTVKGARVLSGTRDTGKTFGLATGTTPIDFDNYVSAAGNDMVAQTTSGLTSEQHLHFRCAGCQATPTTFTATASPVFTRVSTTAFVAGAAIGLREEYIIQTDTGVTSDPSSNAGNSTEWATLLVSFNEVTSGTAHTATPTDTLTLADATTFARDIHPADTLTLVDSLSSQAVLERTLVDTLALADSLSSQAVLQRTVDDTLTVADLITPAGGKGATIDDTLTLSDSLSTQAVLQRTVADTLSLADSLSSQAVLLRLIADTLTLADLADPVKSVGGVDHAQPIADTLSLADSLSSQAVLLRTLTDELAVADSLSSQAAFMRTIADTLTLADDLVAEAEALVEGFTGMFDPDTEQGRGSAANDSGDYELAPAGRGGSRTLSGAYTSVQGGKIGVP